MVKPSRATSASKYFKTSITSLLAADNWNNEWASVKSPVVLFSKGRMLFFKYPSWMSITIDPESSKDGIFWPSSSMEMDRHYETALFRMHCLVSEDTAFLVNILSLSSNLAAEENCCGGSSLTPSLCPWPQETGVFSLTCPAIVAAEQLSIHSWLPALGNFLIRVLCLCNICRTSLGL